MPLPFSGEYELVFSTLKSFEGDVSLHFPVNHLSEVVGWGRTQRVVSYVRSPATVEEIHEVLFLARSQGLTVTPYGAGHSYTDAALNAAGVTLNLSRMRRVLEWNPRQGIIRVEPGATIGDIWRLAIVDGWWPPVIPSTMEATLGGCLAMNVHGKNAWKMGSIGEHVLALSILLASGELVSCTPTSNPTLFHAVIGGLGLLGVITDITLQLRPIKSGKLLMRRRSADSFPGLFKIFAEEVSTIDYLEAWIDGYADGYHLGRGFVECGRFMDEYDPSSLRPQAQRLPEQGGFSLIAGVMGRAAQPLFNTSMKVGNRLLHTWRRIQDRGQEQPISLARFHFHSVAEFKAIRALTPMGISTIEPFIPAEHAESVFSELLKRSQRAGIMPIWCMFKQHRVDPFLLCYQVNGFSLELIYRATRQNSTKLKTLMEEMLEPIIAAGGHLYLSKDCILDASTYIRSMGQDRIQRFLAIKETYDPETLFQSNLFRRLLAQNE